jgi:hypothetical protein
LTCLQHLLPFKDSGAPFSESAMFRETEKLQFRKRAFIF